MKNSNETLNRKWFTISMVQVHLETLTKRSYLRRSLTFSPSLCHFMMVYETSSFNDIQMRNSRKQDRERMSSKQEDMNQDHSKKNDTFSPLSGRSRKSIKKIAFSIIGNLCVHRWLGRYKVILDFPLASLAAYSLNDIKCC